MLNWAKGRGLNFSMEKSNIMCLKGGKKPGFTVSFGTEERVNDIIAVNQVRYLGITLDHKLTYWPQIVELIEKGVGLFSRLRGITSANWGASQATARMLYKAVFLPKILYAADVWEGGARSSKAKRRLEMIQRKALLSVTGAYRTAATHALQVVAGLLPLDLEIKLAASKLKVKSGADTDLITKTEQEVLAEWQARWRDTDKGRWTISCWRLPVTLNGKR